MKKILLLLLIYSIFGSSYGQEIWAKAGYNLSSKFGVNGGISLNHKLSKNYSFEIGVMYNYYWYASHEFFTDDNLSEYEEANYHLFHLPATLKRCHILNSNVKTFFVIGANVGLCFISDYMRDETRYDSEIVGVEIESYPMKHFNMGISTGGGIEIGIIQVGIFLDTGFLNLSMSQNNEDDLYMSAIRFSAGCRLFEKFY